MAWNPSSRLGWLLMAPGTTNLCLPSIGTTNKTTIFLCEFWGSCPGIIHPYSGWSFLSLPAFYTLHPLPIRVVMRVQVYAHPFDTLNLKLAVSATLASEPCQPPTDLPGTGSQMCAAMPGFYVGAGDPHSDLHTSTASMLIAEHCQPFAVTCKLASPWALCCLNTSYSATGDFSFQGLL